MNGQWAADTVPGQPSFCVHAEHLPEVSIGSWLRFTVVVISEGQRKVARRAAVQLGRARG